LTGQSANRFRLVGSIEKLTISEMLLALLHATGDSPEFKPSSRPQAGQHSALETTLPIAGGNAIPRADR
jgi:hypothetical protein